MRAIALVLALMLAACGPAGQRIAGENLDEGGFGNPTRNNMLVMTGEAGFVTDLNVRFAQSVPTVVTFAFNSAALSPQAVAAIDRQADFMRQFPELRFSVYGFADAVGGESYNERLGRARAQAVVAQLGRRGVSSSRLAALVSYGETRPAVATEEPEQRNRRAITQVSGFVSTGSAPTVLDGKYAEVIAREYVASAVPPPGGHGFAVAPLPGQ